MSAATRGHIVSCASAFGLFESWVTYVLLAIPVREIRVYSISQAVTESPAPAYGDILSQDEVYTGSEVG